MQSIPLSSTYMQSIPLSSTYMQSILTFRKTHYLSLQPIPSNVFIVAACNPHRGNSLDSHSQKETWVRGSYYVRKLHPTLRFLMWDYGSLDECQEREYINAKMKMFNKHMPSPEVGACECLVKNNAVYHGIKQYTIYKDGSKIQQQQH